jgi:hypothetical protein
MAPKASARPVRPHDATLEIMSTWRLHPEDGMTLDRENRKTNPRSPEAALGGGAL